MDNANFSEISLIKKNYFDLKDKLGRIPALSDFDAYGEMDVLRIFDNDRLGSYYKFLVKYEKAYTIRLSEREEEIVEFISKKLANGKRIQELQLLKRVLAYARGIGQIGLFAGLSNDLRSYGKTLNEDQKTCIVNILTNEFAAGSSKNTYANCVFIKKEGNDYYPTTEFVSMLSNRDFYGIVSELIDFGINRYKRDYSQNYGNTDLVLYQKYTYEDVCRLLNWEKNEVPLNIGGYKYDQKTKTFPVFITYEKAEDISDSIKYKDRFVNSSRLISESKAGRRKDSKDVQQLVTAKEQGIRVELFVRKNKDDQMAKEFYYLGAMTATGQLSEKERPENKDTVVEIEWQLEVPVREDIYEYIVNA